MNNIYSTVDCSVADAVATIVLNRPRQRNAIDLVMRKELADVVQQVAAAPEVRAVVVTGAGEHFCAGGDVKTMGQIPSAEQGRHRNMELHPLITGLLQLEKPVVAAVEGVAFGAGFGLAMTADFLVAGAGARLCCSFARVGLVPDFATAFTLPRLLGLRKAKELIFSARELSAAEALAMGVITEVRATGTALPRARELAATLAQGSPIAFGLAKRMLNASSHSDLAAMLAMEADGQGIAFASSYHAQAVQRFLAREPATFQWPKEASE